MRPENSIRRSYCNNNLPIQQTGSVSCAWSVITPLQELSSTLLGVNSLCEGRLVFILKKWIVTGFQYLNSLINRIECGPKFCTPVYVTSFRQPFTTSAALYQNPEKVVKKSEFRSRPSILRRNHVEPNGERD